MSAISSKEPYLSVESVHQGQNHKRCNKQHGGCFRRTGIILPLDLIVDIDRERACHPWNVAADHEHDAKLAHCMGEAQHKPCHEPGPGLRHDNTKKRFDVRYTEHP